ncbi:MAG: alcohol dehydrogenase catalytic domain-containing protein [Dehalococcoidales bacterium]|nr:alcohol dehydrogenase catalytic domain-containing protein [Dehalococcoidales bacterium]
MKACVATGEKRHIECKEIPIPTVEPGWLLLKTKYACICGSDLEYLDGSFGMIGQGVTHPGAIMGHRMAAELGLDSSAGFPGDGFSISPDSIPGHEFIAEVVEVGEGVSGWSVGDRAIPFAGRPNPLGPATPGYETYKCMAEYFVSAPLGIMKVPDHVSDEEAVFVEPLCTGNQH